MKANKLISAISLALILLASASVYAINPTGYNQTVITSGKPITYEVKVDPSVSLLKLTSDYIIFVSNDKGNVVAPPQHFKPGKLTYIFTESGQEVTGTRTAHMVTNSTPSGTGSITILPTTLKGPFFSGSTYVFLLVVL